MWERERERERQEDSEEQCPIGKGSMFLRRQDHSLRFGLLLIGLIIAEWNVPGQVSLFTLTHWKPQLFKTLQHVLASIPFLSQSQRCIWTGCVTPVGVSLHLRPMARVPFCSQRGSGEVYIRLKWWQLLKYVLHQTYDIITAPIKTGAVYLPLYQWGFPIPTTKVKEAYDWKVHYILAYYNLLTLWSSVAQLVEYGACNTRIVGSIPGTTHI